MGRRGRDRMVVGILTTYVISAYHNSHQTVISIRWEIILLTQRTLIE